MKIYSDNSNKNLSNKEKGKNSELLARRYLEHKGYSFVESNYYCRYGEIDVICKDLDTVVFVEVRMRSGKYCTPEESITWRKKERLYNSIMNYTMEHKLENTHIRFDVVAVDNRELRHYKAVSLE